MVAFQMGATRMSGLVGNVTIPKQTVGATAYWLSTETTNITEGNQTFAQLALTPRTVGAYTQISRLLQLQSSPDAEALILTDLAKQVAIAADKAVLYGTGTEQPTGITQTASIGTLTSGTSFDYADILEFQTRRRRRQCVERFVRLCHHGGDRGACAWRGRPSPAA